MIELTAEQGEALEREELPPRAVNPDTQTTYVLITEEVYERVKSLVADGEDNEAVHAMYPHDMQVFGRDGWDDPAMDVYDELDPRNPS